MKNYKKCIDYRIISMVFFLILQLVWFLMFFIKLMNSSIFIRTIFIILSLLSVLHLFYKKENTPYKIGWLVVIITVPLLGAIYCLLFRNKNRFNKLANTVSLEHKKIKQALHQDEQVMKEIGEVSECALDLSRYIQNKSDYPLYKNTSTMYYPVGEMMYEAIVEEMEKAEHFIFIEFFIIEQSNMWDKMLGILIKKAAQGVDIRIMYDDMACLMLLPSGYAKQLESLNMNIKCKAFNPYVPVLSYVMNGRDHRKTLVIDGHTAFNGGMNLADEYINTKEKYGYWKDNGVMIKGEAVWNFTAMFLEMWHATCGASEEMDKLKPQSYPSEDFTGDGYIQPFGDTPFDQQTVSKNVYIKILNVAKKYVYIFTPYLIIDKKMKTALGMAAKRGVDVRIVTPGIPDKKMVFRLTRSNYAPLLESGVRIYEYTPGFIHAKSYVCDDEFAVVGSINMEYISFHLYFECGTFMYKTSAIMELKKDCIETIEKSREITIKDCRKGFFGTLSHLK